MRPLGRSELGFDVVRIGRARTWVRAALAACATFAAVISVSVVASGAAQAVDGSAVTVSARVQDPDVDEAPLPDLEVTVSQTQNLIAQAITVSWKGGKPSSLPSSQSGGENYLQIMQCWGDVTDAKGDVGPDRTTCQFGGFVSPGAVRDRYVESPDAVAKEDLPYAHLGADYFDPSYVGIPFRSVTGTNVESVVDGKIQPGVNLNTNAFFTKYTTNEVPWAGSAADGTGSVTFEVQTALAAPGLGCGSVDETAVDASSGRSCWLVIVPRGEGANVDSALFWDEWKHRIAVPLQFQPVGQHCVIGSAERQLAGTELAADAVAAWQSTLCGSEGGAAYTLLTTTDTDAAGAANSTSDAPLALTSQALDAEEGVTDNLTYAPIALTGVSVAFAIDRFPSYNASEDARSRARIPFSSMKLTPRLLAKLLTSSYSDALAPNSDKAHLGTNPRNLLYDPDFLAINDPEWAEQAIVNPAVADVMVPQGRSGYAEAIWDYILADADARAFMEGRADPWGMVVNPYASIDPELNPTGSALEVPRSDFPKVDPSEGYPGQDRVLNSVTWRPYLNDLASGAYNSLRGDGLTAGDWDPFSTPPKWSRNARSLVGARTVMALTTAPAAARYETVTASLLNPAGQFVTADTETMLAAAAAMVASETQTQVRTFDPTTSAAKAAPSAYPLTMPVYAATDVTRNSSDLRTSYAQFVRYAATSGQTPGVRLGELPPGYAPLPQSWRDQALLAADQIEAGVRIAQPAASAPVGQAQTPAQAASAPATRASAAAPSSAVPATDPAASGVASAALSAGSTPDDPDSGALSGILPIALVAALLAAVIAPLIGRSRRRL